MTVPHALIAKKAIEGSSTKTGDLYTRRWTTTKTKGKGKKKQTLEVEHELHVNALAAAGTVAAGALALGLAGVAAWAAGIKVGRVAPARMVRAMRVYDTEWIDVKIVDQEELTVDIYDWVLVADEPEATEEDSTIYYGGGGGRPPTPV